MMGDNLTPLVSIVITTKNEEKNIQTCLDSIFKQSYLNIEIIVIDNYSSDNTAKICTKNGVSIFSKGPERSAQRNFGIINIARGKYAMYVDADMILSPDLIESSVKFLEGNPYVALYIREVVLGNNYFSRVRRFERSFYDGTVIDGARFFKRSEFINSGGFDEKLFFEGSGEDWDLDKSLKQLGSIGYLDRMDIMPAWDIELKEFIVLRGVDPEVYGPAIFHNESDFKLIEYLRKKRYYSKGFDGYIRKWGKSDPDIRKQLGFYYRYIGVFIEENKYKKLLKNPILSIGMYFLRFLVGVMYITNNNFTEK